MKRIKYLALASFSMMLLSCNSDQKMEDKVDQGVDQETESKMLMETNRQWASAAPEEFFTYISQDAIMMPPDNPIIQGHQGIGKLLTEFQSLHGFSIKWEPQEAFVSSSGDLGYTVDKILVNFNDENGEKVDLFEKGVTIWKKQNETWEMVIDIWNTDPTISSIYK